MSDIINVDVLKELGLEDVTLTGTLLHNDTKITMGFIPHPFESKVFLRTTGK